MHQKGGFALYVIAIGFKWISPEELLTNYNFSCFVNNYDECRYQGKTAVLCSAWLL